MQREFDKLDVDLKFMDLAIKIFELIEAEIKKGVSIADLNRLARTMLLVQKSVKSMKIPKTDRTLMRNMNSVAKMMDALDQLGGNTKQDRIYRYIFKNNKSKVFINQIQSQNIKMTPQQLVYKSKSWKDFENKLSKLQPKERGTAF